jgi:DNA recombination protein RmuC
MGLRAALYRWRQEQIAENARENSENDAELYKRLRTLAEHIEWIGGSLRRAVERCTDAVGSIKRSVLPAARWFKDLGATTEKIGVLDEVEVRTTGVESEEWYKPVLQLPTLPPLFPT